MKSTMGHRCFFTTTSGYIGIGPEGCKPGDHVVLLLGGDMPFVLRSRSDHYQLIGDAYVHGVMHGELMQLYEREDPTGPQCIDFTLG